MTIAAMYERLWRFSHVGNDDIRGIRRDIVPLMEERLESLRDQLGYWEKAHILDAINAFEGNLQQEGSTWLLLSLLYLEKASTPNAERAEDQARERDEIDEMTIEDLRWRIRRAAALIP
jgi:hypothetical protein